MGLKLRLNRKKFLWGCSALLLLIATGYFSYQTRPRQIFGSLLRLESVPSSVRNVECESWGITDVLTTCYFEIDPAEFPALLKGWAFRQTPAGGGSHSFAGGPRVGPDFPVTAEFIVQNPPEFPHGGHVILVADGTRARVQVNYYQE